MVDLQVDQGVSGVGGIGVVDDVAGCFRKAQGDIGLELIVWLADLGCVGHRPVA